MILKNKWDLNDIARATLHRPFRLLGKSNLSVNR